MNANTRNKYNGLAISDIWATSHKHFTKENTSESHSETDNNKCFPSQCPISTRTHTYSLRIKCKRKTSPTSATVLLDVVSSNIRSSTPTA